MDFSHNFGVINPILNRFQLNGPQKSTLSRVDCYSLDNHHGMNPYRFVESWHCTDMKLSLCSTGNEKETNRNVRQGFKTFCINFTMKAYRSISF